MADFNLAIETVLANEGGLSENPSDPGGLTNFGISQRCISESSKVLMADLAWKLAGDLHCGDVLLGFDEFPKRHGKLNIRRFRTSTVLKSTPIVVPSSRIITDTKELKASDAHQWLRRWGQHRIFNWSTTEQLLVPPNRWTNGVTVRLGKLFEPWNVIQTREAGYLGGVLDGEGSISTSLDFSQKRGNALVEQALRAAQTLNWTFYATNERHGVVSYRLKGDGSAFSHIRAAGIVGANRLLRKAAKHLIGRTIASTHAKHDAILAVESLGPQPMMALETSTKTLIVDGYFSHNSYPNVDIRNLTRDAAAAIYQRDFWHYDAVQSQAMATKIFDMSVNMGHAAIRILQTCLGITVDGLWGPGTCAAVNAAGDDLLNTYRNALSQHYQNLVLANPALAQFLKGWLRRAAQ